MQSEFSIEKNIFEFLIPVQKDYPFVTIKAVYVPTGDEVYYKAIELKSLEGSVSNYSSQLLLAFGFVILFALGLLVWITQKISRKGYVHVGQDETMIV